MSEDKRSHDIILKSFIKELRAKGVDINFESLGDKDKLEVMQVLISECNKHMKPFVVHVLGYDWFWYHDVWFDNYIKYDINCIVASRGLGKSFFWSRMLPQYITFVTRNYGVIISSYNEPATNNFVKGSRQDLEYNDVLKAKISTSKVADANKTTVDFNNGSSIHGISITSQIRGRHVNYVVADDIINDEQRLSAEQIKAKIFSTILPVLQKKRGKFALIGTRFTEDDIYAYFKEHALIEETYKYTEFNVELDEEAEVVYINHLDENGEVNRILDTGVIDSYSYKSLLSLKMVEPAYFSREYECNIVSNADVPFPLDKLLRCKDKELSYEDIKNPKAFYYGGLDFSNSTKKGADETVLMIGTTDTDNKIVVANIFSDNTMESPERTKYIKKRMFDFGMVPTLAEQNSMGLTTIQELNKDNFRITPFYTDRNKKNDITDYASSLIKVRDDQDTKVRFPYRTAKDQFITDKLIHQLSGVRAAKTRGGLPHYVGTTKHDDFYIGFVLMVKHITDNKFKQMQIFGFKKKDLLDSY